MHVKLLAQCLALKKYSVNFMFLTIITRAINDYQQSFLTSMQSIRTNISLSPLPLSVRYFFTGSIYVMLALFLSTGAGYWKSHGKIQMGPLVPNVGSDGIHLGIFQCS